MTMRSLIAVLSGSIVLAALPAQAQQKVDDVIKFRKALMQVQGQSGRLLFEMIKGDMPFPQDPTLRTMPFDRDRALRYAGMLEVSGRMILDGYPEGSEKGTSENTRARPEIWSDSAKFKQAVESFLQATAQMNEAVKVGTPEALRPAFAAMQKQCGGCHADFRAK